jgi:uncharacterized protein YpuA (DUF1002 family)
VAKRDELEIHFGDDAERLFTRLIEAVTAPVAPADTTKLDAILREQRAIRRLILALTQNEQQAVNDLSAAVETLATDLSGVSDAAAAAQAKIQAFMDQDVVDAADKAALQAIIDSMESDVVGALAPITSRLGDIDANFHDSSTPLTPTP